MKFKELSDKDKLFLKRVYTDSSRSWKSRMRELEDKFEVDERTARKWCEKLELTQPSEKISEEFKKAKKRKTKKGTKRFVITWAQNNTPVHERFFRNLKEYSKFLNAELLVIAGRYKNPTSIWSENQEGEERWNPLVVPYLDANRHNIHKYLTIMSDFKIQPTAVNPMSGTKSVSKGFSCIFGAPKLQMEMIPVLEDYKPKMMLTTGACTIPNYTDSKAGKKAEFHHVIGFCVVEIKDDETFYVRQVSADGTTGNFTDLIYDVKFSGTEKEIKFSSKAEKEDYIKNNLTTSDLKEIKGSTSIKEISKISACILGDLHYGNHDQEVLDSTEVLLGRVNPENVVLHDVFDGYSINHHEAKNLFAQYAKEVNGKNDLKKEIDEMLDGLSVFEKYKNVVIVRSNHDDFLDRWLINSDWKKQPTTKNSPLYMKYAGMLLEQYAESAGKGPKGIIPTIINERYPNFITLGRSDSYKVKGYELGKHGDEGSGGSRGSLEQFRSYSTKIVVGHYHAPERKDGALAVGTTTKMRLGYNSGGSKWLQSHVIIHDSGKAQHINFLKDKNGNMGFTTLF